MDAHLVSSITGGKLKGESKSIKGFSIDSRKIQEGEVFVALKGSRFDGHDFIKEAFNRGAVGVISERDIEPPDGKFIIRVDSSLEALRKIAKYKRENFKGKVIGIAGSAGKTTTKELVAHLLSFRGKVFKTPGNLNSQIGLPLALANAPTEADFWVLELGASKLGEIRKLTELSLPHIRVITALGEEHLEGFGSLENVIKGNGEIFEYWLDESVAIIPHYALKYYSFLRRFITFGEGGDIKAKIKEVNLERITLIVDGKEFFVPVMSVGMVNNTLAAFGVLKALGFDYNDFREALKNFKPEWGRMELLRFPHLILINDAYNSNPLSLKNAINTVALIKHPKKILILGDMLELGRYSKELHEEIGNLLSTKDFSLVIFVGKEMYHAYKVYKGEKLYFESQEKLKTFIQSSKNLFKDGLILLKGSRGMRLEELIPFLREVR
ncbi:UDP-N-acetylmuramoyl-tripeptide--D-alanyl-D-alanine ligase [Aquifex sp.]